MDSSCRYFPSYIFRGVRSKNQPIWGVGRNMGELSVERTSNDEVKSV